MNNKFRLWLSSRVLHSTRKPRWAAQIRAGNFASSLVFAEMRGRRQNGLSRKHSRSLCRLPCSGSTLSNRLASTKRSSASQYCPTGRKLNGSRITWSLPAAAEETTGFIDKLYIGINFVWPPRLLDHSVPQRVWLLRNPRRRIKWPL
jgi:hypothetical protein